MLVLIKPLLAAGGMALFILVLPNLHLALLIPLAALIYLGLLVLLGVVGHAELDMVRGMAARGRTQPAAELPGATEGAP
jgi:hypothetical protein